MMQSRPLLQVNHRKQRDRCPGKTERRLALGHGPEYTQGIFVEKQDSELTAERERKHDMKLVEETSKCICRPELQGTLRGRSGFASGRPLCLGAQLRSRQCRQISGAWRKLPVVTTVLSFPPDSLLGPSKSCIPPS